MGARAERERESDMEMMISGGGTTEAAITRKPLHLLPALSLGGDLRLCGPPFAPAFAPPPLLESQGHSVMLGDPPPPASSTSR